MRKAPHAESDKCAVLRNRCPGYYYNAFIFPLDRMTTPQAKVGIKINTKLLTRNKVSGYTFFQVPDRLRHMSTCTAACEVPDKNEEVNYRNIVLQVIFI